MFVKKEKSPFPKGTIVRMKRNFISLKYHLSDFFLTATNRNNAPKNGRKAAFELKFENSKPVAEPRIPSLGRTIPLRILRSCGIVPRPLTIEEAKLPVALLVSRRLRSEGSKTNIAENLTFGLNTLFSKIFHTSHFRQ